jgi:GTP pyrophosphokinase
MNPHSTETQLLYVRVREAAERLALPQTLRVLPLARQWHAGQWRKGADPLPYISHPLTMACNALGMGIQDDAVVATILLHDVCEDCGVSVAELPMSPVVKRGVELMTFRIMDGESKEIAKNRYYNMLLGSREATLTKLIDRCHNVSSMAGTFSVAKLKAYIEETRQYVLPLLKKAKSVYPEDADMLFLLKYHITSVVDSIEATIQVFEREEKE